jgi:hypothetical protein
MSAGERSIFGDQSPVPQLDLPPHEFEMVSRMMMQRSRLKPDGFSNSTNKISDQGEVEMPAIQFRQSVRAVTLTLVVSFAGQAVAQKKYDPGATDTGIKIGNIMLYSGPASGKTEATCFKKTSRMRAA